jgi:hypothetical protein
LWVSRTWSSQDRQENLLKRAWIAVQPAVADGRGPRLRSDPRR